MSSLLQSYFRFGLYEMEMTEGETLRHHSQKTMSSLLIHTPMYNQGLVYMFLLWNEIKQLWLIFEV